MTLKNDGLLILPRIRVQNANAISSPLTWGFPSITAFFGFMWNLERKLSALYKFDKDIWYADSREPRGERLPIHFDKLAVVCHNFQAQATSSNFIHAFHLTRNPLDKNGSTKAISEEGRAHLEVSILLGAGGNIFLQADDVRNRVAEKIWEVTQTMRLAGGSILPPERDRKNGRFRHAHLLKTNVHGEEWSKHFRRLKASLLPGSLLVLRDDILHQRHEELRARNSESSLIDAWLDLCRVNYRAVKNDPDDTESSAAAWEMQSRPGWLVPIPVGYSGLSALSDNERVMNTRDNTTPFRFVESIYSIGEWVGVHRLSDLEQMFWYTSSSEQGLYRCSNNYASKISVFED